MSPGGMFATSGKSQTFRKGFAKADFRRYYPGVVARIETMRENAIYFMLGLARRAGHLHSGDAAVRTAVARKKACLLLVTEDAAQRTVKIFEELSLSTGIPLILSLIHI